jgi:hypothetical protein
MRDVLELIVPWTITTTLLFALLRFDERRLRGAAAERAWPTATRMSAIFGFAIFAMPIHCARTRRSAAGVVLGILLSVAILATEWVVEAALDLIPPIDLGPEGPLTTALAAIIELTLFYGSYRFVRRASSP